MEIPDRITLGNLDGITAALDEQLNWCSNDIFDVGAIEDEIIDEMAARLPDIGDFCSLETALPTIDEADCRATELGHWQASTWSNTSGP